MNRKLFEKLGVESSVLGFGAMRLPVKDGAIHRESALEMVDHAYRNGITYFDTAWPYHGGTSEGFLGEALGRYPRESFLLADKMPVWAVNNEADMDRVFHEQLSRCRVPYFDFYLLHALGESRFDHCVEIGALAFLEKMRAQGKLRFIGFSFHDKNENFERIVDYYPWDFVQIQYNYIDVHTMDADFLYKALEQRGIPIVVMEPVRGGALAQLPEKPAGILRSYAPQRSLASWAVRWVASQPGVKVLLSGMSDMGQLKDNIATLSEPDYPLSAVEQDMLARATQALLSYNTVPCTGCGYCMECPFGVDIPRVFRIYNNLNMFSNEFRSHQEYFISLEAEHRADQCRQCGACLPACPQHIDIPGELAKAHGALLPLAEKF